MRAIGFFATIEQILKETPEVATYSRRTGTQLGFFITEPNSGDFAVTLKPRPRRNIEEVMDGIRTRIASEVPGINVEFVLVLQDLIGDLAGAPSPVEVKLFCEDQAVLENTAQDVASRIEKIPGIVDVVSGVVESGPDLVARIDQTQVGRFGLTSDAVATQMNAAMFGDEVTQLLQGDRQIGVRVRYPSAYRSDPSQMALIPIRTPAGFNVPLSSVAHIESISGHHRTEPRKPAQDRVGFGAA